VEVVSLYFCSKKKDTNKKVKTMSEWWLEDIEEAEAKNLQAIQAQKRKQSQRPQRVQQPLEAERKHLPVEEKEEPSGRQPKRAKRPQREESKRPIQLPRWMEIERKERKSESKSELEELLNQFQLELILANRAFCHRGMRNVVQKQVEPRGPRGGEQYRTFDGTQWSSKPIRMNARQLYDQRLGILSGCVENCEASQLL
jgi:hypothetical protein